MQFGKRSLTLGNNSGPLCFDRSLLPHSDLFIGI
jgi:hypothetical protein